MTLKYMRKCLACFRIRDVFLLEGEKKDLSLCVYVARIKPPYDQKGIAAVKKSTETLV